LGADGGFSFSGPISVMSCIGNWFNDFNTFTIGDAVTFFITQRDMYENPVFASGTIPSFTFNTTIVLASNGVTPVTMNSMTISLSYLTPQQQILKFSASRIGQFLLQVSDTNGINIIMSPFDFSVTTGVELAFSI
jgi:hypothetical protein